MKKILMPDLSVLAIIIGLFFFFKLTLGIIAYQKEEKLAHNNSNSIEVEKPSTNVELYNGMRELAFGINIDSLHIDIPNNEVFGVIMDMHIVNDFYLTSVVFKTGDASLYFSNGTTFIGGVTDEKTSIAAKKVILEAEKVKNDTNYNTNKELPSKEYVKFYLITPNGRIVINELKYNLENEKSEYLNLYYAIDDIITLYREYHESLNKK